MVIRRTTCPHCRKKLEAGYRIHPDCIAPYADAEEAKAKRKAMKQAVMAAKVERAETRRRKEELKSLRELLAEVQTAFNEFIRLRDAGKPCICCGKPFEPMKPGGSMDAGHFRSRGSAPQLRFNEDNVFGQRKNCNRPGGTTQAKFRAGVLGRIGPERLEAVERNEEIPKWDKDELRAMRAHYRAKAKELRSA